MRTDLQSNEVRFGRCCLAAQIRRGIGSKGSLIREG